MTAAQPSQTSPSHVVELEIDQGGDGAAGQQREGDEAAPSGRSTAIPQHQTPTQTHSVDEPCADMPLEARVEALLLTTERPLSEARLGEALGLSGKGVNKRVAASIEVLNQQYESTGRSFRAHRLAGGWQLLTLPAFGPLLHRLHEQRELTRLSQPALETLAIVAYRQPIMRAEVEAIRGVASGEVLRSLLERRLVKIVGRAEELGRPMLYGTTGEFLKVFGMAGLDDLPQVKGLNMPSPAQVRPPQAGAAADEPAAPPPPDVEDVRVADAGNDGDS